MCKYCGVIYKCVYPSNTLNNFNKNCLLEEKEPWKVEWIMSPANAPNMNGSVERLIGCAKKALKKTEKMMNEKLFHLNEEGFRAVIFEVIGLLNNRPLCMIPLKGTVNKFLTPNMFLKTCKEKIVTRLQ